MELHLPDELHFIHDHIDNLEYCQLNNVLKYLNLSTNINTIRTSLLYNSNTKMIENVRYCTISYVLHLIQQYKTKEEINNLFLKSVEKNRK